jgi:hypothetical protein
MSTAAWLAVALAVPAILIAAYGLRLQIWTARKDFHETCINDRGVGLLSEACNASLSQPVEPPPVILKRVPKDWHTKIWHDLRIEAGSLNRLMGLQPEGWNASLIPTWKHSGDSETTSSMISPLSLSLATVIGVATLVIGLTCFRPYLERRPKPFISPARCPAEMTTTTQIIHTLRTSGSRAEQVVSERHVQHILGNWTLELEMSGPETTTLAPGGAIGTKGPLEVLQPSEHERPYLELQQFGLSVSGDEPLLHGNGLGCGDEDESIYMVVRKMNAPNPDFEKSSVCDHYGATDGRGGAKEGRSGASSAVCRQGESIGLWANYRRGDRGL